jgi:hypothetical protein
MAGTPQGERSAILATVGKGVTGPGLVSGRSPRDLDAVSAKIVNGFAEGAHKVHDQGGTA